MDKRYILRRNYHSIFYTKKEIIHGKIAFKTKIDSWLNTKKPVVILLSIDSAFHKSIDGDLKTNALINTISSHVQNKITVLMANHAHYHTTTLNYNNNKVMAFEENLKKTDELVSRYQIYSPNNSLLYWHSYIHSDDNYLSLIKQVKDFYLISAIFQELINNDIDRSYTEERKQRYQDKELYYSKALEDIFEQCACLLVLAEKGYGYIFYPGPPLESSEYLLQYILPTHKHIEWVNVFLSVEKKTKCELVTKI